MTPDEKAAEFRALEAVVREICRALPLAERRRRRARARTARAASHARLLAALEDARTVGAAR
jgi:hypothetical protein